MPNERLRMVAELQDRASGPLRRIRDATMSIRQTPGMAQARTWMAGFNKDAESFMKGGRGLVDVMSGMGIGGLAAAASIGTLAARLKDLGTHALAMRELGREVGLTTDEVNQFNHAANHFGFDPDKMQGALDHFAGLMPEFRRGFGELNTLLTKHPDLVKRLRLEDTKTQLKEIFDYLGTIENPQDRIKLEQDIFGQNVEPLFAEGSDGFEKQLDRYAKTLQPITKEMEAQAEALRDAITDFNDAVGNLETKYGPQILGTLKEGALEVKHMFDDVVRVVENLQRWKDHPMQAVNDGVNAATDAVTRPAQYNYDHWHGTGDFRPPRDAADGQTRLDAMARERDALKAQLDADRQKNPAGFPTRHADDFLRLQDLNGAIAALKDNVAKGAFSKEDPGPSWMEQWRKVHPDQPEPAAAPARSPAVVVPPPATTSRPPMGWVRPSPEDRNAFHPNDDDRQTRARPDDARDHSFDGIVVGAIEKPMLHLAGTLRTAAAAADQGPVRQAAFHPAGLLTPAGGLDPAGIIEAGVKAGVLAAFREWAGGVSSDASTGRPGIMPTAFHPGGGGGGGGGNPVLGGGSFARSAPGSVGPGDGSATTQDSGPGFTSGMRARNLGNIGYFHQHDAGLVGPSNSRDVDHSIALYATQEDGIRAAARLALRKYQGGMRNTAALIAGRGGWTPGALGPGASVNIAKAMGLSNQDDLHLDDPGQMRKFLGGLARQEHGAAGAYYTPEMIDRALSGRPADGGAAPTGTGRLGSGDAVGLAGQMLGFGERQSAQALGHIMHAGEWCADFVNGVIEKSGGKGSGSAMASSFARWGRAVSVADAKRGDVILENAHGRGINHVGLVESVDHDKAGKVTGIHMISGNYGHFVRRNLEPFGEIQGLRRGNEAGEALRGAAAALRGAASDQRQAAAAVSRSSDRPDLGAERAKAGLSGPQAVKVAGGIDAHVTLHDNGRSSARVESSGHVKDTGITVRRAPQRTATV